jgi:hypothetical protein
VSLQDPSNRRSANTVAEVLHGALDPRIAPRVVLAGHAQNDVPDGCLYTWTAGSRPYVRTRAPCQLAVPTQNRVCGGNGRHLHQCGTSQLVSQPRASRLRSSSLSCGRLPRSCARNTRFSSRRNAMTSSCSRRIQPRRAPTNHWNGNTAAFYVSHVRSNFGTIRAEPYTRQSRFPNWTSYRAYTTAKFVQSDLSARKGSICAARRAGNALASTAMSASTIGTAANVTGS